MTAENSTAPVSESPDEPSVRIIEVMLGFGLAFPGLSLYAGLPVDEIAGVLLVLYALFRRPRYRIASAVWVLASGVVLAMGLSALLNDMMPIVRLGHVAVFVALIGFVAAGRLDLRAISYGFLPGLLISAGLSLTIMRGHYGPRLSGTVSDPNTAGMIALIVCALAIYTARHTASQIIILVTCTAVVVLTFSRTSLLALGLAMIWILLGRLLHVGLSAIAVGITAFFAAPYVEALVISGRLFERSGSDTLRTLIATAARDKAFSAPPYGFGPGTAMVDVRGQTFFFHNSYQAVLCEGGLLLAAMFGGLLAYICYRLVAITNQQRSLILEAGLVATFVCAINLGEALFTLQAAVLFGAVLFEAYRREGKHWEPSAADERMGVGTPRKEVWER